MKTATAMFGNFSFFVYLLYIYQIYNISFTLQILDAMGDDRYYSRLIPLTIPVGVMFVFFNWLGMNFFRNN